MVTLLPAAGSVARALLALKTTNTTKAESKSFESIIQIETADPIAKIRKTNSGDPTPASNLPLTPSLVRRGTGGFILVGDVPPYQGGTIGGSMWRE